jgi:hypothetical protein
VAKRGRKPKGCTIDDLDERLREQITEAIRSHAEESAVSIYRRFGLSQRGVLLNTFQKHVGQVRREAAGERVAAYEPPAAGMTEPQVIAELRRRVLSSALASLDAGDMKPYEVVGFMSRVQEWERIDIERRAETRAEELHKVKLDQLSKDLRKGIEQKTEGGTKDLSREAVYDLIDRAMRGQL